MFLARSQCLCPYKLSCAQSWYCRQVFRGSAMKNPHFQSCPSFRVNGSSTRLFNLSRAYGVASVDVGVSTLATLQEIDSTAYWVYRDDAALNTEKLRGRKDKLAVISSIDPGAREDLKVSIREAVQHDRWSSPTRGQISELQVKTLSDIYLFTGDSNITASLRAPKVAAVQAALERSAEELDFDRVRGLWKLIYTTAPDVVPLMLDQKLSAPRLPWQPRVSTIYQRFTSEEEGIVQNIVQFGDGLFLDKKNGATFVVNAVWFKSRGIDRTIELTFESVQFDVRIPLPTASNLSQGNSTVTGKYQLTYCDESMLIGRAQVGGGVFIFDRADVSSLW